MGIKVRCSIDGVQVKPPTNIRDLQLSLSRDAVSHGIQFEASTMSLTFIEDAYAYLLQKKETLGIKNKPVCLVEQSCDGDDWDEVINGRLNIAKWDESQGTSCSVSLPIEEDSCVLTLNNKIDQQVDLDNILAQDGQTPLPGYFALGLDMEVPTKELEYKTEGYVADEGNVQTFDFGAALSAQFILIRPDLKNEKNANINQSELTGTNTIGFLNPDIDEPISPYVLFNEPNIKCFGQTFKVNGRLKGKISVNGPHRVQLEYALVRGEMSYDTGSGSVNTDRIQNYLDPANPMASPIVDHPFDWTITEYEWTPTDSGSDSLVMLILLDYVAEHTTGTVTFDKETFFKVETVKSCPPTNTKAYLIHETVSRITESITNGCIRFKSEYYGRRDSEPFGFPVDGCGGLRFLTSGLKLRNAANPTFFASLRNLLNGLQAIDNIGMGIEDDPDRPGSLLMRWEDLNFFYRDQEIMRCPSVPSVKTAYNLSKIWSTIQVGYEKWETQANFGLDEYNSTREFHTDIDTVNSILKITSNLVAGEYPIEITRQQQYVDTSEADTAYDNEIFIMCLRRISALGYPYGEMVIEQGNVSNPENIFSPSSILNYGISPVRNLLRWFRSIAAGYPNIEDSNNKLYFNSGTGNILAKGELSNIYGGTCRLENDELRENQDIAITMFADKNAATPLWRAETKTYEYPMSLKQYKAIKANPYGYISFQAGRGEWKKGYIDDLVYRPFQGMANFKLTLTWK